MKTFIKASAAAMGILLSFCTFALAEPQVVTCEGRYVMGDLDTKQNARMLALMEAKRLALEKVGTYVESATEVKEFQLTKDQIKTLAVGVMAVEVLKEDWKVSGENMAVVVQIRATIDTSNLKDRIAALKEDDRSAEDFKAVQSQIASLQKELAELKSKQAEVAAKKEEAGSGTVLKEKHEDLMKEMTALEFMETANAAMMNQRWGEANDAYDRALKINPKLTDAYRGQALALQRLGKAEQANARMNVVLASRTPTAGDYAAKAMILKNQGNYPSALDYINRAIQMQPRVPRHFLQRGNIRLAMHQPRQAVEDFSNACRLGNKIGCDRAKYVQQKMQQQRPKDGRRTPLRSY